MNEQKLSSFFSDAEKGWKSERVGMKAFANCNSGRIERQLDKGGNG